MNVIPLRLFLLSKYVSRATSITDVPQESRCVGRVGSLVLQEAADADTDAGRSLHLGKDVFFSR